MGHIHIVFSKISGEDHGEWTVRIIQEDEEIRTILNQTPRLLDDVTKALTEDGVFPIIDELLFNSLGMDQLDFGIEIYITHRLN